jgi:hypothetical protein
MQTDLWTRFITKVDVYDALGCWPWKAAIGPAGYGVIGLGTREEGVEGAHRVAYRLCIGEIPDKLVIDHLCRNRRCVNPSHLELVTQTENKLRGIGACAVNAVKTHCKNGHAFSLENTVLEKKGRKCRTCRAAVNRATNERRRAENNSFRRVRSSSKQGE